MKQTAPSAERNLAVILETFGPRLPSSGLVLEVASGTGQHVVAFARAHRDLDWQPSDPDPVARSSIAAYREENDLPNLRPPVDLDVTRPWPISAAHAVININMIHISPWAATEALIVGAASTLPSGGPLIVYGPYMRDGAHTAPSNEEFDRWLKQKDPAYGVRDLTVVSSFAAEVGFQTPPEVIPMPANNFTVVFRRA